MKLKYSNFFATPVMGFIWNGSLLSLIPSEMVDLTGTEIALSRF